MSCGNKSCFLSEQINFLGEFLLLSCAVDTRYKVKSSTRKTIQPSISFVFTRGAGAAFTAFDPWPWLRDVWPGLRPWRLGSFCCCPPLGDGGGVVMVSRTWPTSSRKTLSRSCAQAFRAIMFSSWFNQCCRSVPGEIKNCDWVTAGIMPCQHLRLSNFYNLEAPWSKGVLGTYSTMDLTWVNTTRETHFTKSLYLIYEVKYLINSCTATPAWKGPQIQQSMVPLGHPSILLALCTYLQGGRGSDLTPVCEALPASPLPPPSVADRLSL